MTDLVVAHGGTAGAMAELAFIVVPVVIFMVLSRRAAKRTYADREKEPEEET